MQNLFSLKQMKSKPNAQQYLPESTDCLPSRHLSHQGGTSCGSSTFDSPHLSLGNMGGKNRYFRQVSNRWWQFWD